MQVKVLDRAGIVLPQYSTLHSAGADLRANIEQPVSLLPGARAIIKTGLFIELPEGYEAQIRPRSGLAAKNGITVLNSPGTIDADYRDEIGVILINLGQHMFTVNPGDRIAQMVIAPYTQAEFAFTDSLSSSSRNGGFGHTGIK